MRKTEVIEDNRAKNLDLKDRKYILAHDDDTGDLYVHILADFKDYKLSDHLDEVFGYWKDDDFVFSCLLDNDKSSYTTEGRYLIFKGHLRNSVLTMLKAERKLKEEDLKVSLIEIYKSNDPKFNKTIKNKNLYDFIYENGKFVDYEKGFDYKVLLGYKKG